MDTEYICMGVCVIFPFLNHTQPKSYGKENAHATFTVLAAYSLFLFKKKEKREKNGQKKMKGG